MKSFTNSGGIARHACIGLLLGGALLITACASQSYMGISLLPGQAVPEVQDLARRAHAGDKRAQLNLGIKFEEGNSVAQDRARAIMLYQHAAADSGGTLWVYIPSPGNGAPARVVPVDVGPRQAGLGEAKRRLIRFEGSLFRQHTTTEIRH